MERLFQPAFNEDDFVRLKGQTIQGIKNAKTRPAITASAVYNKILYGSENAFAYPDSGTELTVENIDIEDVKAFYADNLSASVTSVIAVSDLSEAELTSKLSALGGLEDKPIAASVTAPYPALRPNTLYLIDKEGAAQSEIRIGKHALPFDATEEYYRAGLMNFVLGGAFNSRINLNLREDKGYSYGARSFFRGNKTRGAFTSQAGVRTDATAASIIEFMKEIDGYKAGGITSEELAFTKNAIGQRDARDYETPSQKLGFLSEILTYDLPDGFVDTQNTILENITAEEINALADKYLNTKDMTVVVVGDKATILPDLQKLGYDIVELDENGNPV